MLYGHSYCCKTRLQICMHVLWNIMSFFDMQENTFRQRALSADIVQMTYVNICGWDDIWHGANQLSWIEIPLTCREMLQHVSQGTRTLHMTRYSSSIDWRLTGRVYGMHSVGQTSDNWPLPDKKIFAQWNSINLLMEEQSDQLKSFSTLAYLK